jgi:hypothetical protein
VFLPFEVHEHNEFYNYMSDIDPDEQLLSTFLQRFGSSYFDEESFNLSNNQMSDRSLNKLSIFSVNICSALNKMPSLASYLESLQTDFSVVGLTETWLSDATVNAINLPGYSHFSSLRSGRTGGGVSLFIKNSIQHIACPDLTMCKDSIESVFVEIPKGTIAEYSKRLFLGVIYRPPNHNHDNFMDNLLNILQKVQATKSACILMGDFNYDLFKIENDHYTECFLEILYCNSFMPLINRPTRITDQSSTLIDNIFFNDFFKTDTEQGILITDLSDHFPIFCQLKLNVKNVAPPVRLKRNFSERNTSLFVERMEQIEWTQVYNNPDCQSAYSGFHKIVSSTFSDSFPLVTLRSRYRDKLPWLTPQLRHLIKRKNKLYKRSLKNPTLYNLNVYKQLKRKLNNDLRLAEKNYFQNLFDRYKNDPKKTWGIIKDVISCTNSKGTLSSDEFIIGGNPVSDSHAISEAFNNFFINVGPNVSSNIPVSPVDPVSYLPQETRDSIFFSPVTEVEVHNILHEMKNKSPGHDGLCGK